MQPHQRRILYRAEVVMAVVSACLFVLTIIDPTWVETLFDESPDDGDGSLEKSILLGCAAAATVLALALAWRERGRLHAEA
jgi:hypothetical protein